MSTIVHYSSSGNVFPVWTKITVTNSGSNLVVSGTDSIAGNTAKPGALTLSVPLFALPANGYIHGFRIKTSTAFTGTTTLLAGLGTASSVNYYLVSAVTGYDLKAAVAATNLSNPLPLVLGSNTSAAVNIVLTLTSTVENISSISAGVVDVHLLWGVLP